MHLARNNNNIKIWSFSEEERDLINNERKCKFLPNIEILENIKARDKSDKEREIGALKKADDAIYIDSSNMEIKEVVETIEKEILKKLK